MLTEVGLDQEQLIITLQSLQSMLSIQHMGNK